MSLCKSSCVSVYALWFCHQAPQKRLSVFFTTSLQKPLFCWGSTEAFFPQAEQPQLPQPFLMWKIVLSINHFNGSVLESLLWLPAPLVLGSTELDPTHRCILSVLSRAVGSTPPNSAHGTIGCFCGKSLFLTHIQLRVLEEAEVCSPKAQGCSLVFWSASSFQHPEFHCLMGPADKAAFSPHISNKPLIFKSMKTNRAPFLIAPLSIGSASYTFIHFT